MAIVKESALSTQRQSDLLQLAHSWPVFKNNAICPAPHSAWLPSALYAWDIYDKFNIEVISDEFGLLTRGDWISGEDSITSSTPLRTEAQLGQLRRAMTDRKISRIEDTHIEDVLLPEVQKWGFELIEQPDCHDYLYDTSDLSEIDGSKYGNFRSKLNKFHNTYKDVRLVIEDEINKETFNEIEHLYEAWLDLGSNGSRHHPLTEKLATYRMLTGFNELSKPIESKFRFYKLYIGNKFAGYSVMEILTNGFSIGHFLKLNLNITGVTEFMVNNIAKDLRSMGVRIINAEEDHGIKGLRIYKTSLRPTGFIKSYSLTLR